MEIWKKIKGHEGLYWVSNNGKIKSKYRILKLSPNEKGYLFTCISKNGKGSNVYIHRIVWDVFGDGKRDRQTIEIDHIDDDKTNNHIDNLQLLSHRENIHKYFKKRVNNSSNYIGVCWDTERRKWRSQLCFNSKQRLLGRFNNEIDAAFVYQEALAANTARRARSAMQGLP